MRIKFSDVAEKLSISRATLSEIRHYKKEISPELAERISGILDFTPEEIRILDRQNVITMLVGRILETEVRMQFTQNK